MPTKAKSKRAFWKNIWGDNRDEKSAEISRNEKTKREKTEREIGMPNIAMEEQSENQRREGVNGKIKTNEVMLSKSSQGKSEEKSG